MRSHRYALAIERGRGRGACWGCTRAATRVCVKIAHDSAAQLRVADASHRGRYAVRCFDSRAVRRQRSVALHEAVPNGWDATAVQAALLGDQRTLRYVWAATKLGVWTSDTARGRGSAGPVAAGVAAMS